MAVKRSKIQKYTDPRCPFCAKASCVSFVEVGDNVNIHWQIRTKCGFSSKLFRTENAARVVWGTRGGRAPALLIKQIDREKRRIKVIQNPTGKIGDRVIGGPDSQKRRKAELEAAANAQSSPSEEAMLDAAKVNKTGSKLNRELVRGKVSPF